MVIGDINPLIETLQEYVRSGKLHRQFRTDKRLQHGNHKSALQEFPQDFAVQFVARLAGSHFHDVHSDDAYIVRSVKYFITDYFRRFQSRGDIKRRRLICYRGDSRDVISYVRRRGNRDSTLAEKTADEDAVILDTFKFILRLVETMPEKRRRVVELFLEGESTEAIARTLGITPNTVTSHLSLALQDVLEGLREEGNSTPSREPHDDKP
jgi:DNA-directed RNA polymerase specialized sigma24 family protein